MDSHVLAQIADRAVFLSERLRAPVQEDTTAPGQAPDQWKREAFHEEEPFRRYLTAHGTTEGHLARVLLGLLRMAEPTVVPSVLHLEAPRRR